ncbi:MAG: DUF3081 family protein [Ferrimonas sp.]
MTERIKVTPALRALQLVTERGTKTAQGYCYQGFIASGSWDDYHVTLSHDNVSLELHFHNSYQLHSPNDAATERFIEALGHLLGQVELDTRH